MITLKSSHVVEAVGHLIQKFRGKVKTEAFVTILASQIQDLENALFGIIAITDLDTVTGIQLDVLGKILNQPRNGQSDETYRLFLRARILVNISTGTVEEILSILSILLPSIPTMDMLEPPYTDPAHFEINVTSPEFSNLDAFVISTMALLAKSPAIGGIIFTRQTPAFRFDTVGGGFGQGNILSLAVD